jgi:peroxiredoxin
MTFIANAANLAADANGALTMSAGKLRGAFRRLFASDWSERWMVVVNDHAVGTLARDAEGLSLAWFDENGGPNIAASPDTSLANLHQEIARKLDVAPRRVVFLPIGE